MCSTAPSMSRTRRTASTRSKNSRPQSSAVARAAPDRDAACRERPADVRQERTRHVLVYEEALEGVAHTGLLDLAVDGQIEGHPRIAALVEEEVADALVVLQDRYASVLRDEPDEPLAAPGNDESDDTRECDHAP